MSQHKLSSDYQNGEQSENQRKRLKSGSSPVACIVCDKVFFDNVSLVLHFDCHLQGEVPSQLAQRLASLRSSSPLSLTSSPYPPSSVGIQNEGCVAFPRMSRLPVSSAMASNSILGDVNLVDIPVLNSMPPLNSSYVSQPFHRSMMNPYGIPSSSGPLMYSQSGLRSFSYGLAAAPRLQLQSGGHGRVSSFRNPSVNQIAKPPPEIIVISDDDEEEDDGKKAEEIDLTLKL